MSLVVLDHVDDVLARLADGLDDLVGLRLLDARVVGALRHEERDADFVRVEDGRYRLQQLLVLDGVPDLLVLHLTVGFPVGGDALQQGKDVGRPHVADGTGVEVGREGRARQGRVAAVAAAVDGQAFGVGDASFDEPLHAVGDVVLHGASPLLEARLPELLTVAGGAAEVDLEHRRAAVGQKLRLRIEPPTVARAGAAVRDDDQRKVPGRDAEGERQVAVDRQSVARGVLNGLHRRHLGLFEPGRVVRQLRQAVVLPVEEIGAAARAVPVDPDGGAPLVVVHPRDGDLVARKELLEGVLELPAVLVEEAIVALVRGVDDARDHLALLGGYQAGHVHVRVLEDEVLRLVRVGVEGVDGDLVAPEVRGHVEELVVVAEHQGEEGVLEVRGDERLELVLLRRAVEQAGVDAVRLVGDAEPAVVVGQPAGDVAGVLGNLREFPRGQLTPVDVEDLGIAPVHLQQHMIRVLLQVVQHPGSDAVERREVPRCLALDVRQVDVEVLVPALVLNVYDAVAALPEEAGDIALRRARHALLGARLDIADVDVHPSLPGLDEGQFGAVGRQGEGSNLGVAEEILHREDGRNGGRILPALRGAGRRGQRQDAAQNESEREQIGKLHGQNLLKETERIWRNPGARFFS